MEGVPQQNDSTKEIFKKDFHKIFFEKFASIKKEPYETIYGLHKFGIKEIEKELPTIVFGLNGGNEVPSLWSGDFDQDSLIYSDAPHVELREDLGKFLNGGQSIHAFENPIYPKGPIFSSYVIQDKDSLLYLILDSRSFRAILDKTGNKEIIEGLKELTKKYNIAKIILNSHIKLQMGEKNELFLTDDIIGEQRQYALLAQISKQVGLTSSQYMRFRAMAKSIVDNAKENGKIMNNNHLPNLFKIAKEIKEESE